MRRIAMFFVATVASVMMLFSYRTSLPGDVVQVSRVSGAAHVVSGGASSIQATVAGSAPPSTLAATRSSGSSAASASTSPRSTSTKPSTTKSAATSPSKATTTAPTAAAPVVVDGSVVDTNYGPVQVEVRIAGGKITQVTALQYPSGGGRDVQINSYAIPQLVSQTLTAQSAKLDGVSGATYTTQGFMGSLQSALDAAHFLK